MIIRTGCSTCGTEYELLIQTGDLGLLRKHMNPDHSAPCPTRCGGRILLIGRAEKMVVSMTGTELASKLEASCG
jgi:DNA-directed RNA polymerase subunit RPC12/RpoP